MFLGMLKETSKDKKWSKGSKESAEGQGKAIQVWFTWGGKISYNKHNLENTPQSLDTNNSVYNTSRKFKNGGRKVSGSLNAH